jgi:hypothetical protein
MKNLKIQFYKSQEEKPEKTITIPLSMLQVVGKGLIWPNAKNWLKRRVL